MSRFVSPYPPYDPTDPTGFSYDTVLRRWPVILTNVVDHVNQLNHEVTVARNAVGDEGDVNSTDDFNAKIAEGCSIISAIGKLKYEMARDKEMPPIEEDGGPHIALYNEELGKLREEGKDTWFKCPWLFAECYIYRLLRSYFARTTHWSSFDPFRAQKEEAFKGSKRAVYKLASTLQDLYEERNHLRGDEAKLEVLWKEMIQMCLWGNATDLSLLSNLTHDDIEKLQTVERDEQAKRAAFILRNDSEEAWEAVKSGRGKAAGIVLDNAGFELYTDILFADFLVNVTPYVPYVVFHPKTIPWFVSDTLATDVVSLLEVLEDHTTFFAPAPSTEEIESKSYSPSDTESAALTALVARWKSYFHPSFGRFRLSIPLDSVLSPSMEENVASYWTLPYAYWDFAMDASEELKGMMKECSLVVFKGDLNYRKLTGDVKWPPTTPFTEALGPLAGQFPILSLRTNKADVIVGLKESEVKRAEEEDEKWRVNGRYAVISYAPVAEKAE